MTKELASLTQNSYEQAIECFDEALDIDSEYIDAGLAKVLLFIT